MKAFANRAIDWHDVEGVIARQGPNKLDWDYVFHYLTPLAQAKEQTEITERLGKLAAR